MGILLLHNRFTPNVQVCECERGGPALVSFTCFSACSTTSSASPLTPSPSKPPSPTPCPFHPATACRLAATSISARERLTAADACGERRLVELVSRDLSHASRQCQTHRVEHRRTSIKRLLVYCKLPAYWCILVPSESRLEKIPRLFAKVKHSCGHNFFEDRCSPSHYCGGWPADRRDNRTIIANLFPGTRRNVVNSSEVHKQSRARTMFPRLSEPNGNGWIWPRCGVELDCLKSQPRRCQNVGKKNTLLLLTLALMGTCCS